MLIDGSATIALPDPLIPIIGSYPQPLGAGFLDEALHGRAADGFADRRLQQPAGGVSPRDRQAVLAAFLARPVVMLKGGVMVIL